MTSATKSATSVQLSVDGPVATIQFVSDNGVQVFSSHVLGELGTLVRRVAEAANVRFVVFRGTGKTFVAGADIAEMASFTEDQGRSLSEHGHHVFDAIEALPQITIAALNGHALGGGCELALACDFRLAASGAKIGLPECRLGLIPGWGGTIRMRRIVGEPMARRLIFSGEPVAAAEAKRIGLVCDVIDNPEQMDAAINDLVTKMSQSAPAAILRVKRAMFEQCNPAREREETKQFSLCFTCGDAREGMAAFMDKRPPKWAQR